MRVARVATIGLLVLRLSLPALAKRKDSCAVVLEFELIEGLAIVQVETSAGRLRLLADTGSNTTTLDEIGPQGQLAIKVKDCIVLMKAYPTQTAVFAQLNATLPKERRLHGVLGQDFFSHFSSVAFDYAHHRLILNR